MLLAFFAPSSPISLACCLFSLCLCLFLFPMHFFKCVACFSSPNPNLLYQDSRLQATETPMQVSLNNQRNLLIYIDWDWRVHWCSLPPAWLDLMDQTLSTKTWVFFSLCSTSQSVDICPKEVLLCASRKTGSCKAHVPTLPTPEEERLFPCGPTQILGLSHSHWPRFRMFHLARSPEKRSLQWR